MNVAIEQESIPAYYGLEFNSQPTLRLIALVPFGILLPLPFAFQLPA